MITAYRDHGHVWARGTEPKLVMANLREGHRPVERKGRFDAHGGRRAPSLGGYAIVGGHIPLATGLALSIRYRKLRTSSPVSSGRVRPTRGVLRRSQSGRGMETAAGRDRRKQPLRNGNRLRTGVRGLRGLQESVRLRHPGGAGRRNDVLAVRDAVRRMADRSGNGAVPN